MENMQWEEYADAPSPSLPNNSGSTVASRYFYRIGAPNIEEQPSSTWINLNAPLRDDTRDGPSQSLSYFSANVSLASDPSVNGPTISVNSLRSITRYYAASPDAVEQGSEMSIDGPPSGQGEDRPIREVYSEMNSLKSYMVSAKQLSIVWANEPDYWRWVHNDNSSFGEVAVLKAVCWLDINGKLDVNLLSPEATYTVYLIYKLSRKTKGLKEPYHQIASIEVNGNKTETTVHLHTKRLTAHRGGRGWKQIKIGEFYNRAGGEGQVHARILGSEGLNWKNGLIIEGMEFRAEH